MLLTNSKRKKSSNNKKCCGQGCTSLLEYVREKCKRKKDDRVFFLREIRLINYLKRYTFTEICISYAIFGGAVLLQTSGSNSN